MDCGFQVKDGERNILSPSLSSLALVIGFFFFFNCLILISLGISVRVVITIIIIFAVFYYAIAKYQVS